MVVLPFQYTPTEVGDDGEIEIFVASDAQFDANNRIFKFEIPVVSEQEENEEAVDED